MVDHINLLSLLHSSSSSSSLLYAYTPAASNSTEMDSIALKEDNAVIYDGNNSMNNNYKSVLERDVSVDCVMEGATSSATASSVPQGKQTYTRNRNFARTVSSRLYLYICSSLLLWNITFFYFFSYFSNS